MVQWLRLHLPMQGVQVQFLIRELRSYMLQDQKKQNIKQKQYCTKFSKGFEKSPHLKKNLKKINKKRSQQGWEQIRIRDSGRTKQDKIKGVGAPFHTCGPRSDMDAWKLAVVRTQERTGQAGVNSQLKLASSSCPLGLQ